MKKVAQLVPSAVAALMPVLYIRNMDDWLKIAKKIQLSEYTDVVKQEELKRQRRDEIIEAEKSWTDRVLKRVEEINSEGFFIHVAQKDDRLRLVNKGEVEIELKEHLCFLITYRNIRPPTTLIVRTPIFVHHHRRVKVRELNAYNIEELLKFVVLGMRKYSEIASRSRIENNLQGMIESQKTDEHEHTG